MKAIQIALVLAMELQFLQTSSAQSSAEDWQSILNGLQSKELEKQNLSIITIGTANLGAIPKDLVPQVADGLIHIVRESLVKSNDFERLPIVILGEMKEQAKKVCRFF